MNIHLILDLLLLVLLGTFMVSVTACGLNENERPAIARLVHESRNKKAIVESNLLQNNPLEDDDVPHAVRFIQEHRDYASYHLLMTLNRFYPKVYEGIPQDNKAAVLSSTLRSTLWLNDWGYLSPTKSHDGDAAKALLKTGKNSLKYLIPILEDETRAPLFGSESATISKKFSFRRKDFAFRYISIIIDSNPRFDSDVAIRNKDIEVLKAKLSK